MTVAHVYSNAKCYIVLEDMLRIKESMVKVQDGATGTWTHDHFIWNTKT